MDRERLRRITEATGGSPNRMREPYLCRNHPDLLQEINEFTGAEVMALTQRIWHWVNGAKERPLCACGRQTTFNKNWTDGYRPFCSSACSLRSDRTKGKRKETTIKKYGVDNIAKSDATKARTRETNLERYGHASTAQSEKVKDKQRSTTKERWGVDHYFQTEDFKSKMKRHYLEKWGVDHQSKASEVQDRIRQTCLERYEVSSYLQTPHARESIRNYNKSRPGRSIAEWIRELGFEVLESSTVIYPLTVDIFVPGRRLAIEYNGLYWHNERNKDKTYHSTKTERCREAGIDLIHVWEDDWKNKTEIVKSIIKNRLGVPGTKVAARKCMLVRPSSRQVADFLNANHIQGHSRYGEAYGLEHEGGLVAVMTFGWRSINGKREYELLRYAGKVHHTVTGGASRLLKAFLKETSVAELKSYADRSMFTGGMYERLGFTLDGHTATNYWWIVNGVRRHRFAYNKQRLVRQGHPRHMTEVEIMHGLGHYRVFGCGQSRYVYKGLENN